MSSSHWCTSCGIFMHREKKHGTWTFTACDNCDGYCEIDDEYPDEYYDLKSHKKAITKKVPSWSSWNVTIAAKLSVQLSSTKISEKNVKCTKVKPGLSYSTVVSTGKM